MNKSAAIFAAIAITTSIAATHLWMELREERAANAQSRRTQAPPSAGDADEELPEVVIVAPKA